MGSRIHREVYVRFRGEDSETCCCEAVRRRILSLQHRPDSPAGKAGRHHPQPRDLCLPGAASTVSAQGHLQGQRRYHHRQHGYLHLPGRQGADHPQRAGRCAGQGDHRHLQHRREPWAGNLPLSQLPKARQRAYEPG